MIQHQWQRRTIVVSLTYLAFLAVCGAWSHFATGSWWIAVRVVLEGTALIAGGLAGAIAMVAAALFAQFLFEGVGAWIRRAPGHPEPPPKPAPHDIEGCEVIACDSCDRLAEILATREVDELERKLNAERSESFEDAFADLVVTVSSWGDEEAT